MTNRLSCKLLQQLANGVHNDDEVNESEKKVELKKEVNFYAFPPDSVIPNFTTSLPGQSR